MLFRSVEAGKFGIVIEAALNKHCDDDDEPTSIGTIGVGNVGGAGSSEMNIFRRCCRDFLQVLDF